MKCLIIIIISIVVLVGCGITDEDVKSFSSKTVIQDGFELTITLGQSEYSLKKLFRSEPLDITATLTYIGIEEKVIIWHADRIGTIFLYHDSGSPRIGPEMNLVLRQTILNRGESLIISHDYTNEYYKDKIVEGDYTAVAEINIAFDDYWQQVLTFSADIPFTITE